MENYPDKELRELWSIMERLLAPDGCPWDRKQTDEDIARHLLDEGHEWLEAIREGSEADRVEELGDVAYLVVFGLLDLGRRSADGPARALASINAKLKRRHPHIFGEAAGAAPGSVDEQLGVWEEVKRRERAARGQSEHLLKKLPGSMGALAKSHRYQELAARVGFDWPDLNGVRAKLAEELAELDAELASLPGPEEMPAGQDSPSTRYREALAGRDLTALRDELGDLLFVVANLCRWTGCDAEQVAEAGNAKFLRRFTCMEESLNAAGRSLKEADLPEMEHHWQAVKKRERTPGD